ncbi:MAG TPA: UDP-N-acetylglucosamine pyrophosphorylase [Clostridium sp.]|nr:UDP-N-acetylglucosamine pyrophosphorylase [Clostridium sp.]
MNLQLTVYELGALLKRIEEKCKLEILIKSNLSGGWMTITGPVDNAKITRESITKCGGNKDNIIDIIIEKDGEGSIPLKITGASNKKFDVNIAPAKYRELSPNNLSLNIVKANDDITKLRIDENIIFTIKENVKNIEKLI